MYPDANIWVTGHSLGGSLSGLLGITFGAPVVTFEAPADKMASRRLHLPKPVRDNLIAHGTVSLEPTLTSRDQFIFLAGRSTCHSRIPYG